MAALKPYEIYWTDLSGAKGHEESFDHPSLIVAIHESGVITAIPLTTSKPGANSFSSTYTIKGNKANGLKNDSVALIFQIRTLDPVKRIGDKIGDLETDDVSIVKDLMSAYLNLK